jgi:hypothetical protein
MPTNFLKKIFFISIISLKCYSVCYFIPPKNFEVADPKALSQEVLIGFIKKGSSFNPSLNLAEEKTKASLSEYVKAIKNIYKNDKNSFFRELGALETKAGTAALVEISSRSTCGEIRLMQAVLISDGIAYVLTSCCSKEDFMKYLPDFMNSFKSLSLTNDLLSEIKEKEEKELLEKILSDFKVKKNFLDLEKHVSNNYLELGSYWKILFLKEAYKSIH